jgi:type II secretory pathway pseudopilin PulG
MRARLQRSRRLTTARQKGQSLPFIALMIVVLVAMVGLSVDVGNTFSEERQAVAAGNAAAVAAMDAYIDRTGSTTTKSIYDKILNTLSSNGVDIITDPNNKLPGQLELEAIYLDAQGKPIPSGTGSPFITDDPTTVPNNVAFIQVNLKGQVDTYFARVVGRQDLPINATAHAGTCPLGAGIYPIAINTKWIDGDKFRQFDTEAPYGVPDNNWRVLTSGPYPGRTAMRLDVQDGQSSGGFSWLRWMEDKGATGASAKSARELEASLTIPGNAASGFQEAPWPTPANKPADYPERPGQLNVGDWVWGSPGYQQSTDELMNFHISEGTQLVLPIYDASASNGANAKYHVNNLGLFVLLGHGKETGPGGEKYVELVYLGDAAPRQTACSYSAAPNPGETYSLIGQVQIRPEYAYVPTNRKPIQYVVVLDVSGSMSANFSGQCNSGGSIRQCTNGPDGAPPSTSDSGGNAYYWNTTEERRIYVAKTAIESLVRSTNMGSGRDTTRPADQMALVWYNDSAPSGNTEGFSSSPGDIIDDVRRAGRYGSNNYLTSGGTNGAAALYRAALMLDAAPKTVTENGQTWEYKRAVIFITDGVSNRFLDTSRNDLRGPSSNKDTYPSNHVCHVNNVIEIASCQVTAIGGKWNGMDRPITQAGNVSKNDLQANGSEVYVISLSNIPATGLQDSIASFPKYYFAANSLERDSSGKTNVDKIMEVINTLVESGVCERRSDVLDGKPEFKDTILPGEYQAFSGGPTYPTVGEVLLENVENGTQIRIPIMADSAGRTSYTKNDVPKGNYKLTPYVFYRHPLDPPTFGPRRYSLIDNGSGEATSDIVITVGPQGSQAGSFVQQNRQDLKLRLFGDVCTK